MAPLTTGPWISGWGGSRRCLGLKEAFRVAPILIVEPTEGTCVFMVETELVSVEELVPVPLEELTVVSVVESCTMELQQEQECFPQMELVLLVDMDPVTEVLIAEVGSASKTEVVVAMFSMVTVVLESVLKGLIVVFVLSSSFDFGIWTLLVQFGLVKEWMVGDLNTLVKSVKSSVMVKLVLNRLLLRPVLGPVVELVLSLLVEKDLGPMVDLVLS